MLNVCRSFTDVLHILAYLLLVFIATAIALFRYDINLYYKHVYTPLILYFIKKKYIEVTHEPIRGRG